MITDNQTNKVYLAQGLAKYHPHAEKLIQALDSEGVNFSWLPRTESRKHIWARDYMPIQLEKDLFLQYRYKPDYLKGYPQYISNYKGICADLGLNCFSTDIVLDGGNVIKCGAKVILTDKIFKENPHYERKTLVDTLEDLFRAELVLIPWDKYEMYGHADGMVRYIDNDRVLMNNYVNFDTNLRKRLLAVLTEHFEVLELDYAVARPSKMSWVFLNYLQVKDCIFVPWLPIWENKQAQMQLTAIFCNYKVNMYVPADDIALEGGGLNCISWNILADEQARSQEEALLR